jgi:XTP/dITP diphosphohydrolase
MRLERVVLATGNPHKVAELRAILEPLLPGITVEAYDGPSPVEDGDTFVANALIKARAAADRTGLPAIADDSGITVDALGGEPGIHSARYSGTGRDDDNRALLLERMRGVADRRAEFVCAAVLVGAGDDVVVEAHWPGLVLEGERGSGGFGYDPVFQPEGLDRSAAELSAEEKNAVSHRGQAFRGLARRIAAADA